MLDFRVSASMRAREGKKRPPRRGIIPPVNHLTAADLEEVLPKEIDLVFATVREPLSRLKSEYRYQYGASRIGRLGFSTWLRVVVACMKIDPRMYENHVRPQSDLVPEGAEIFRLEDGLDAIVDRLDEVLGEKEPDLKIEHLLKRKQREIRLSRQDLALVVSVYAADYQRFGYSLPEESDSLPSDRYAFLREAMAWILAPLLVFKHRRDWLR